MQWASSNLIFKAPEDISKPEVTKCDPHAMKLARLQWELAKRKELSEEAEKEEVRSEKRISTL